MADRYFVGTASPSNYSATSSWSATSGGASGASVPGAGDDVHVNAASTGNLKFDVSSSCQSIDFTGYTHTVTAAGGVTLTVAGVRADGVCFKLVAGFTWSATALNVSWTSTSATVGQITFAGNQIGTPTFNGAGGSWQLQDGLTTSATTTLTLTAGTLDTNGQTCSVGVFSSNNANARTLTLGATRISLLFSTGGTVWNVTSTLTLQAGTSTIVIADTGANQKTFIGSGLVYNNLSITGGGAGTVTLKNSNTFATVTVGAPKTVLISSTQTQTMTLLIANGTATNGITIKSDTGGTQTKWAFASTTGSLSLTYVTLQDINNLGPAVVFANPGSTDGGNNTGITWAAPSRSLSATQTQAVSVQKAPSVTRTSSQSATPTVVRGVAAGLAASQSATTSVSKTLPLGATQSQAVSRALAISATRALSQAAILTLGRAPAVRLAVSSSASPAVIAGVSRLLAIPQPQAPVVVANPSPVLAATQLATARFGTLQISRTLLAGVLEPWSPTELWNPAEPWAGAIAPQTVTMVIQARAHTLTFSQPAILRRTVAILVNLLPTRDLSTLEPWNPAEPWDPTELWTGASASMLVQVAASIIRASLAVSQGASARLARSVVATRAITQRQTLILRGQRFEVFAVRQGTILSKRRLLAVTHATTAPQTVSVVMHRDELRAFTQAQALSLAHSLVTSRSAVQTQQVRIGLLITLRPRQLTQQQIVIQPPVHRTRTHSATQHATASFRRTLAISKQPVRQSQRTVRQTQLARILMLTQAAGTEEHWFQFYRPGLPGVPSSAGLVGVTSPFGEEIAGEWQ